MAVARAAGGVANSASRVSMVRNSVAPGATAEYAYAIPDSHMGGTHWYHPHTHGASTMQVGGGALGMLIIDDPPGALPPVVAAAPEAMGTLQTVLNACVATAASADADAAAAVASRSSL